MRCDQFYFYKPISFRPHTPAVIRNKLEMENGRERADERKEWRKMAKNRH